MSHCDHYINLHVWCSLYGSRLPPSWQTVHPLVNRTKKLIYSQDDYKQGRRSKSTTPRMSLLEAQRNSLEIYRCSVEMFQWRIWWTTRPQGWTRHPFRNPQHHKLPPTHNQAPALGWATRTTKKLSFLLYNEDKKTRTWVKCEKCTKFYFHIFFKVLTPR